ncbi:alpha-hydroxy acid oxidase [Roseitranquillus sediminis]|uniref:alpha-hydroxy acid oxidase n=1 Tax=Roseitranquillus sediminis TaxID=2809051 RepID=UPI001D0C8869|nr:alpha-hydroxy acid oxidase [Roseitranquillus sediminis]MBM9595481.1 alpha-hydroxy-acid oxidizing protein [Roseitranquillus sediminis]
MSKVQRLRAARPRRLRGVLALDDLEPLARRHLPRPVFGYIRSGSETDFSMTDNRAAFADYGFVTRVLQDVSGRTLRTDILGESYDAPFGIAPMGMSALAAYRGDLELAAAASEANVPMIVSGSSLIRLEEIRAAAPKAWFQAYLPGDAGKIEALVDRVARAGFEVLVLTVDTPTRANRESNIRTGFTTPLKPGLRLAWDGICRPRWTVGTLARTLLLHGMPHFENSFAHRGAPIIARNVERDFSKRDHLNWTHFDAIRAQWKGRLLLKGVSSVEDAVSARARGADGVILSNHGGRQLDGTISPLRVLERSRDAVGDWPLMMDGGIRRGTDVMKALALGADFVFVGRPFLYAASLAGRAGVAYAIRILADEVERNMGLIGIRKPAEMNRDLLVRVC